MDRFWAPAVPDLSLTDYLDDLDMAAEERLLEMSMQPNLENR